MTESRLFWRLGSWSVGDRVLAIVLVVTLIGFGTWLWATTRPAISCADGVLDTPESMTTAECEALRAMFEANTDYDTDRFPEYEGYLPRAMRDWPTEPNPCLWTSVQCNDGHLTELHIQDRTQWHPFVIPEEIGELTTLRRLELDVHAMDEPPKELAKLTGLTVLVLRSLVFPIYGKDLAAAVSNMPELEELTVGAQVDDQVADDVYAAIVNLPHLTQLSLRPSARRLPDALFRMSQLTSLEIIGPADATFTEFPERLTELSNLTHLSLAGNRLPTIPAEIAQLTKLTSLDLSHNELDGFPAEVLSLPALRSLNLAGTGLTTLPREIATLSALEKLDVSSNSLSDLPVDLAKLPALSDLSIGENPLGKIPAVVYDVNPVRLDAHSIELTAVRVKPGQLTKLKDLDLSYNYFTDPPSGLSLLPNLDRLNLHFARLKTLPEDFAQLAPLDYLDLSSNQVTDGDALAPFVDTPGYLERLNVRETCLETTNAKVQQLLDDDDVYITFDCPNRDPE